MNPVEIVDAVSDLAAEAFDADNFPFAFLQAFGNKQTTLEKLKKQGRGSSNFSDIAGAVLQRNHIHLKVCAKAQVSETLVALRESEASKKKRNKVRFILATDGATLEAEDLISGETVACDYPEFHDHFGFFLPLAGISMAQEIRENPFDIRATGRLNKLYIELLKQNPDWGSRTRRSDLNQFMARLIFCFYAEDTGIFPQKDLFTKTLSRMATGKPTHPNDSSAPHRVMGEIFRTMNIKGEDRVRAEVKTWAQDFPYVNGGLFAGNSEVPMFSPIAFKYLLHIGALEWEKINPDIFGSMIQAVADEDERGNIGMHYTSVPNILKLLNPLFLDDLRQQLATGRGNKRKLLALRQRLAKIRVFDPACGSGNFLVIAYKEMRKIEAEINKQRGEAGRKSDIPLTNFRGIELRDFACEIARLALIIAEFQCDEMYLDQRQALAEFLPLSKTNWITCGNALGLDWLSICPPTDPGVGHGATDLLSTPHRTKCPLISKTKGGETYICGNPPYLGDKKQSKDQKDDIKNIFEKYTKKWRSLDYVAGWLMKAADYGTKTHGRGASAFVVTNSICQGQQVPILWPLIFNRGQEIFFAHTSFKWSNLAQHNAGVVVVIIGLTLNSTQLNSTQLNSTQLTRYLYTLGKDKQTTVRATNYINAYLLAAPHIIVSSSDTPVSELSEMLLGNFAKDDGNLIINQNELDELDEISKRFLRPMYGGQEFIKGIKRYCFWVTDEDIALAKTSENLSRRFERVRESRLKSIKKATVEWADRPHRFVEIRSPSYTQAMVLPIVSSEERDYLTIGCLPANSIVSYAFGLYDAPLWNISVFSSKLHRVWAGTVCGRLGMGIRYSNTLGWNTFPLPTLTHTNKQDLTRSAENILLAREQHFPKTIADLYHPAQMPADLAQAHQNNDDILEAIYIGRRFNNDTERLEKLFELYTRSATDTSTTDTSTTDTGATGGAEPSEG